MFSKMSVSGGNSHGSGAQNQSYERLSEIGKGAYSAVYKGIDRLNPGRFVAMKEVRIQLNNEEGVPMTTIREIGLLRQLDKFEHPNVVRLLDVVSVRESQRDLRLNLIFEHIEQDLAQYLALRGPLMSEQIQSLMCQILRGVDFIHTHRIVHRDLKPQNILVSNDGCVKLADFGLARVYGFNMALTSVVVTLYYRAPEVLLQDQYCAAVDIWSCGCIFAELHTRRPLFPGTSEIDQLCKIFELIGLPPESDWPENVSIPRSAFGVRVGRPMEEVVPNMEQEGYELMKKMLEFKQMSRISAVDALETSYFTGAASSTADRENTDANGETYPTCVVSASPMHSSSSSSSSSSSTSLTDADDSDDIDEDDDDDDDDDSRDREISESMKENVEMLPEKAHFP